MRFEMRVYHRDVRARVQGKIPGAGGKFTVGRKDCDCNLNDPRISRVHAAFFIDSRGDLVVRDLTSTNGTFVNHVRVTQAALQEGDEVRIGETTFLIAEIDWTDVLPRGAVRLDTQVEKNESEGDGTAVHPSQTSPLWESPPATRSSALWAVSSDSFLEPKKN